MKKFSITAAAVVLAVLLVCSTADAKITRVAVSKDSKIAKELGYTITLTANTENSGLAGTTSFEFRAPKNPLLQNLSAIVLRTSDGKKLTGLLPLEFQKGKSGEVTCHFQLAPEIAKHSTLELICPIPGMPNGTIYDVDLATYLEPSEGEKKLAAAFKKAVADLPAIHPNILEIRDGAKVFTDSYRDADAVKFLKKLALDPHEREEQLVAFIGLALLAEKHDTASLLKSSVVGQFDLPSKYAFLGISFLPTKDARAIAEAVVVDPEKHWQTRALYLDLLRAIGDQDLLTKLEKLERAKFGPYDLKAIDGAVRFLKERLSLKDGAERDRWERQELLMLQISRACPDFRFTQPALEWTSGQIHKCDNDISIGLLKSKLSVPRSYAHDGVPLAAAIAGLQKNRELLPLLDKWAETNLDLISDPCREAARRIRGKEKP
jgi:hypothetical protein